MKKTYSKDKNDYIRFRVSSLFKYDLLMLAQSKGITLTELILNALNDYLEKESK